MPEEALEITETKIDPKIEQEALRTGWVPKEQFKGNPERWRPAEQWVERGREFIPFIKAEKQQLEQTVEELNKKLGATQDMIQKMVKVQSKYTEDQYDSKLSDIKTQKAEAVKSGDLETYNRLEVQEAKLKKPEPIIETKPEPKVDPGGVHPDVQKWQVENKWYGADPELTEYMDIVAERVSKKGHAFTPYQFCEEVSKKVKQMFPDKFKNPNQNRSEIDESGLRGGDTSPATKKGWSNLPPEAKAQCAKLVEDFKLQGVAYTKEQYVSDYFEGE